LLGAAHFVFKSILTHGSIVRFLVDYPLPKIRKVSPRNCPTLRRLIHYD
jgi:hypothetical protein